MSHTYRLLTFTVCRDKLSRDGVFFLNPDCVFNGFSSTFRFCSWQLLQYKASRTKMCFVSIHLAENHYYDILHYERNAFQPLWRDSHPQTPISLIVFKVFVVHFKQHMSQTFMSCAEFLFIGQREGFFVLQHWRSENTSVVWGRACPSSPNRKNEREEKLLVFARHVQKELLAHPNLLLSFHLAESGVRFGGEEKSSH